MVRRFDAAAEWACDRAATEQEAATVYARALLRLGVKAAGRHAVCDSPAARSRPLAARIRRLVSGAADDSRLKKVFFGAAAAGLAVLALVRVEIAARRAGGCGRRLAGSGCGGRG